jgi:uncharacterized membrane-anchored protein YhcB (DUF1043 family)
MGFIFLVAGIIIGFIIAWLFVRNKNNASTATLQQQLFTLTK